MDDSYYEGLKVFERQLVIVIVALVAFGLGFFAGHCFNERTQLPPETVNVDSLIQVNDSIKIVVNDLDSIKNAKIIEVQTLDNDSTLKLFYELISK